MFLLCLYFHEQREKKNLCMYIRIKQRKTRVNKWLEGLLCLALIHIDNRIFCDPKQWITLNTNVGCFGKQKRYRSCCYIFFSCACLNPPRSRNFRNWKITRSFQPDTIFFPFSLYVDWIGVKKDEVETKISISSIILYFFSKKK